MPQNLRPEYSPAPPPMENPYSLAPLQITLYDVPSGAPVRSYMLLGDVPRAVLEEIGRAHV